MTNTRIVRLALERFRGVAAPLSIDLDADVVLVRGDNGLGKTSIVDGLTWLTCGALPHLADRLKGLRRESDPIHNTYTGGPAKVRLTVVHGAEQWEFERVGGTNSTILTAWCDGDQVQSAAASLAAVFSNQSPDALSVAIHRFGILRQDAILTAMEGGAALHERLASVVGLDRVTGFAASAARVAKTVAQERKQTAQDLEELRALLEDADTELGQRVQASLADPSGKSTGAAAVARLTGFLPEGLSHAEVPSDLDGLVRLGRTISEMVEAVETIAVNRSALLHLSASSERSFADLETQLARASQRAEDLTSRLPRRAQLASVALDLLSDQCPVCGQPISAEIVRAHLEELLADARAGSLMAAEAQLAVGAAQQQLEEARLAEGRRREAVLRLEASVDELRGVAAVGGIELQDRWLEVGSEEHLVDVLRDYRDRLRELHIELQGANQAPVEQARTRVAQVSAQMSEALERLAELDTRLAKAKSLDRASHIAAERIVQRALHDLEPSFAEVFDRLSPHPTFTRLRARQDVYYGHNQVVPEVFDPVRRIAANPLAVYSEGQLNVVALSYFLGMALNAGEGALPFMVLDDPLQAMDAISVLGFADLCRRLREGRQLIVTTHDRRFADILERKLAPREASSRTRVVELTAWTREGPTVEARELGTQVDWSIGETA